MNQEIYNENEQALKEFLLDISCLDQLAEWSDSFNLFDVLKITRVEIRHSNMLAWLLDPNENHGLEKNVLEGFIRFAIVSGGCELSVFDLLKITYEDFCVYREWNHLDILAVSKQSKIVLCIENKIDSGEGYRQLERYRKWIYDAYPEYQKVLIFLFPNEKGGKCTCTAKAVKAEQAVSR
ncbi:PDDEXK-like family protein [Anaerotignum lactatifermentans]|uniref:PDDEXK-like family protein n=1 Tax=Anaerotignum lactatifermentans TaxID=160404 RepID=UPI002617F2BF|nr:PD-(D/E)XK nuclease family protein [Anaerotignum lactatifermentans]